MMWNWIGKGRIFQLYHKPPLEPNKTWPIPHSLGCPTVNENAQLTLQNQKRSAFPRCWCCDFASSSFSSLWYGGWMVVVAVKKDSISRAQENGARCLLIKSIAILSKTNHLRTGKSIELLTDRKKVKAKKKMEMRFETLRFIYCQLIIIYKFCADW